jgi:hypothetical protein
MPEANRRRRGLVHLTAAAGRSSRIDRIRVCEISAAESARRVNAVRMARVGTASPVPTRRPRTGLSGFTRSRLPWRSGRLSRSRSHRLSSPRRRARSRRPNPSARVHRNMCSPWHDRWTWPDDPFRSTCRSSRLRRRSASRFRSEDPAQPGWTQRHPGASPCMRGTILHPIDRLNQGHLARDEGRQRSPSHFCADVRHATVPWCYRAGASERM